jgi:hypothetical protein
MDHKIRIAKALLLRGDKKVSEALSTYRNYGTYPDYVDLFHFAQNLDPRITKNIWGNLAPRTWAEFGSTLPYAISSSLQRQLTWNCALFFSRKENILRHLELRAELEISAFEGDWNRVLILLEDHEKAFGHTLWNLRWKLLSLEEGGEDRRQYLESIVSESERGFVAFLGSIFSHSMDKSLPADILRASIRSAFDSSSRASNELFALIALDDCPAPDLTASVLKVSECLPLIDRYEAFIKLASHEISKCDDNSQKWKRAISKLATEVCDYPSTMIRDVTEPTSIAATPLASSDIVRIWDDYFAGNYRNVVEYPYSQRIPDLTMLDLVVKSKMYAEIPIEESRTPNGTIQRNLYLIHSRSDQSPEALNRLDQFSVRYPFSSLSAQCRHVCVSQTTFESYGVSEVRNTHFATSHSPRLLEPVAGSKHFTAYIDAFLDRFPQSISLRFIRDCNTGAEVLEKYPEIIEDRKLFFLGLYTYKNRDFKRSIACLEEFLKRQSDRSCGLMAPFAVEEAKRILIAIYEITQNPIEAQRLVVETYQVYANAIRRMPVRHIYRLSKQSSSVTKGKIFYPIICWLCTSDPHEVCMALKHFLKAKAIKRPSELLNVVEEETYPQIATLFLRVCTPEVLDSVRFLETEEKVEKERLQLLKWVAENSPSAIARAAENEKLRLIQEAQLRTTLELVDENRVVLNISSLREAEEDRLKVIHDKYRAQQELAIAKVNDDFQSAVSKMGNLDSPQIVVLSTSDADAKIEVAYKEAFTEIRRIFLTSPYYGLEACLSGRVRHGILVEHIIRPLRSRHLLVSKEIAGRSDITAFWRRTCSGLQNKGEAEVRSLLSELETMTKAVISLAKEVKDVWIQSRTENKNPGGLFDFEFTDSELRKLLMASTINKDNVDEFLDHIFLALSSRTRSSLSTIRRTIKQCLKPELSRILNETITRLQALGPYPEIRAALIGALQDSEIGCDEMIRWFQKATGALMEDVDFQLICQTASGMVERLYPDISGKCSINVKSPFRVKGRHVNTLIHVLFFLLENAVKYSTDLPEDYSSELLIEAESNLLRIRVSNSMHSDEDAEAAVPRIKNKLDEVSQNLDPVKVIEEGGSGFAKIIAAFTYEFKQGRPRIEVNCTGQVVTIEISAEMAGLAS